MILNDVMMVRLLLIFTIFISSSDGEWAPKPPFEGDIMGTGSPVPIIKHKSSFINRIKKNEV